MSRLHNLTRSLASGYAAMASHVIYTLAAVPLALHYLDKEQFGLWAMVTQVGNYLALIDFGMSGSISLFLIDHKDNKADGQYGSVVKTAVLVLLVQGACIVVGGTALSFALPALLQVPSQLSAIFQILVAGQCTLLGLSFVGRISSHILQAHQRFDILNYSQIAQLSLSFLAQWLAFHWGWGLYSFLLATLIGHLCGMMTNFGAVFRLNLLAPKSSRGQASKAIFKRVFRLGSEYFLLLVGLQLLNASQVLIISRTQGLAAAAAWSIATRTFQMAFLFVQRIFDYAGSALGEMMVRGEHGTLRRRYRDILLLTASVAVFTSASVALCNYSFVVLWTKGEIAWRSLNDALLAILLILNLVTRCQIGLAGYAKQVRTMRWIYFLEGVTFVIVGTLVAPHFGIPGIIVVAIISNLAWSGTYGIRWAARYLGVTSGQMVLEWLRPAIKFLFYLAPCASLLWWATSRLPALPRLSINATVICALGLTLLWLAGLSAEVREELKRALRRINPWRAKSPLPNTAPLGGPEQTDR
jgi:hypothetical protein